MKFEMMSDAVAEELDKRQLAIDMLKYRFQKLITENQAMLGMAYDIDEIHSLLCDCDSCLEDYENSTSYKNELKERLLEEEEHRKEKGYDH